MEIKTIKGMSWAASAVALSVALVACSGSGNAPVVQTGQLVDASVQGASYKAAPSGLSGVTDVNGNYSYLTGDKVVFSFGNIVFPAVDATGTVTPQVLAGTTSDDFDNQTVKNIARFLQSLDANGNPSDGIVIDPAKIDGVANLDFTKDPADFEADFKAAFPTDSLVTEADAIAHLQCELTGLNCNTSEPEPTVEPLPDALSGKSFDLYAASNASGSPYYDGQKLRFTISTAGVMAINEIPSMIGKSAPSDVSFVPVTVNTYEKVDAEYKWTDTSGGFSYTVSLSNGALHEINVNKVSDGVFKAQFTTTNPCLMAVKSSSEKSTASISLCPK